MGASAYPKLVADRYQLGEQLGEGGMGVVFRGQDQQTGRPCAVKFLTLDALCTESGQRRFRHECEALPQLRHPNIVQVYAAGVAAGFPYLVMELCTDATGQPFTLGRLQQQAEGRRLPAGVLLALLPGLFSAVACLHRQGLIHRDLKPENVLLLPLPGGGYFPKLSDFGLLAVTGDEEARQLYELSVSLSQQANSATHHSRVGTYAYMSPEQKRGEVLDARSDVYSLGLIVYRLATGYERLGRKVPSEVNAELPAWLDDLIEGCVGETPGERPADAQALYAALPAELRQQYDDTVAAWEAAQRPRGRSRGRRVAVLTLTLALTIGLAAGVWSGRLEGGLAGAFGPGPQPPAMVVARPGAHPAPPVVVAPAPPVTAPKPTPPPPSPPVAVPTTTPTPTTPEPVPAPITPTTDLAPDPARAGVTPLSPADYQDEVLLNDQSVMGLAIARDGRVYYVDGLRNALGVLDLKTLELKSLLSGLNNPKAVGTFGSKVYFTEVGTAKGRYQDGTLSSYDTRTRRCRTVAQGGSLIPYNLLK